MYSYTATGFPKCRKTGAAFVSLQPRFSLGSKDDENSHVCVVLFMSTEEARRTAEQLMRAADDAEGIAPELTDDEKEGY